MLTSTLNPQITTNIQNLNSSDHKYIFLAKHLVVPRLDVFETTLFCDPWTFFSLSDVIRVISKYIGYGYSKCSFNICHPMQLTDCSDENEKQIHLRTIDVVHRLKHALFYNVSINSSIYFQTLNKFNLEFKLQSDKCQHSINVNKQYAINIGFIGIKSSQLDNNNFINKQYTIESIVTNKKFKHFINQNKDPLLNHVRNAIMFKNNNKHQNKDENITEESFFTVSSHYHIDNNANKNHESNDSDAKNDDFEELEHDIINDTIDRRMSYTDLTSLADSDVDDINDDDADGNETGNGAVEEEKFDDFEISDYFGTVYLNMQCQSIENNKKLRYLYSLKTSDISKDEAVMDIVVDAANDEILDNKNDMEKNDRNILQRQQPTYAEIVCKHFFSFCLFYCYCFNCPWCT